MINNLETRQNEYFSINLDCRKRMSGLWVASIELVRNDSREIDPDSFVATATSMLQAYRELEKMLDAKPWRFNRPADWQSADPCRQIVWKVIHIYKQSNRKTILRNSSSELLQVLENLDEKEKARLFVAPESVYMDPFRSYSLLDGNARSYLFSLLPNASDKIVLAYTRHEQRVALEYEKWKWRNKKLELITKPVIAEQPFA